MPLPKHLDSTLIQNTIDSYKDVDGLTFINAGRLVQGMPSLVPCTPKGIIDLLDEHKIKLEGSQVVVIGRSVLVGKPMANLLTNRNASVTICHSKTKDINLYTKNADIVIVAVGKAGYLKEDMISPGTVVIDVGINRVKGKLYGDVDYENVSKIASHITPVPGGVGPMTVYELMHNVLVAHNLRIKYSKKTSK
jgi:methylenetetrahydrofolate dehydrogenase (NADP+)/methenyltetrahydrofolate cyclohydrolase